MKVAFIALSVVCLLAVGGCGSTVNVTQTPEWKRSFQATNNVQRTTMQRDAYRKYDPDYDDLDEAMWATAISAAHQWDKKQITEAQYDAIIADAIALRTARRKSIQAAEDAAYYARRAATRSYSCTTYSTGTRCY